MCLFGGVHQYRTISMVNEVMLTCPTLYIAPMGFTYKDFIHNESSIFRLPFSFASSDLTVEILCGHFPFHRTSHLITVNWHRISEEITFASPCWMNSVSHLPRRKAATNNLTFTVGLKNPVSVRLYSTICNSSFENTATRCHNTCAYTEGCVLVVVRPIQNITLDESSLFC